MKYEFYNAWDFQENRNIHFMPFGISYDLDYGMLQLVIFNFVFTWRPA